VISIIVILLISSYILTGCYGKFQLTKKLYTWNGTIGDKWVNSLVTWILIIIPVYEVVGFIDFAILNVIEFWTGENPVVMESGEMQVQYVELHGKEYEIIATENRFDIIERGGNGEEKRVSLIYERESRSWFVENEKIGRIRVAQIDFDDSNIISLFQPDGGITKVNLEINQ
jgi:hypothetical protein